MHRSRGAREATTLRIPIKLRSQFDMACARESLRRGETVSRTEVILELMERFIAWDRAQLGQKRGQEKRADAEIETIVNEGR